MSAKERDQNGGSSPSMGAMLADIRSIVGLGTRRPGYAQGLAVERWIEERLRALGLADVRREPVPVHRWEPGVTALALGTDGSEVPCFPIPYTRWTEAAGIEAPLAFVGEGAPEALDRVDLCGKVAVLEARFAELSGGALKEGAHFLLDEGGTIPDGPLHAANWLLRNFTAYYDVERRGAAGLVGLLVDAPVNGPDFYVPYDGILKGLPAVWVGREHAARLRDAARAGVMARLLSLGETATVDSHNVLGVVPGRARAAASGGRMTDGVKDEDAPPGAGESIVVTCHHDAPFASAVEDASGLAVLLALARALARAPEALERDVVFVASSGHFHGGIGNRVLVARHREGFLASAVAALGVEHIAEEAEGDGRGGYRLTGRPEVRALFVDGSAAFRTILEEEARRAELDRMIACHAYLFGPEPPCDSAPYFTEGIPSACHIAGPLYLFDPHDTLDKVRADDLPRVARFFLGALRRLDTLPATELARGMHRPRGSPPAPLPAWFQAPP